MNDEKDPRISKDEIIAQYNRNANASDYQPTEVADIASANTPLELTPKDYDEKRLLASIRSPKK